MEVSYKIDPYKRTKERVALVGFSPATRDLAPYSDPNCEVWGLNEEYTFDWMKRFDRWFQMHPEFDFLRTTNTNDPNHPYWLRIHSGECLACKGTLKYKDPLQGFKEVDCPKCTNGIYTPPESRTGVPIYMQQKYRSVPGSIAYPLQTVIDWLMPQLKSTGREKFFTSSPAYMLGLAGMMGFKWIGLFGFDMGSNTEYHFQRENFAYIVGLLQGKGIEVYIPKESGLLKGGLYGYENVKTGYRQDLEMRKIFLEGKIANDKLKMYQAEGRMNAMQRLRALPIVNNETLTKLEAEFTAEHRKAQGLVNFKSGAMTEVEQMTKMYDAYFMLDNGVITEAPDAKQYVKLDYAKEEPKENENDTTQAKG